MAKQILILDSEMDVCDVLAMSLEGSGYRVESRTTWTQSEYHIRHVRPDAIVLGFGLRPDFACRLLGQLNDMMHEQGVSIPVVMLGLVAQNSLDSEPLENYTHVKIRFCPYATDQVSAHLTDTLTESPEQLAI